VSRPDLRARVESARAQREQEGLLRRPRTVELMADGHRLVDGRALVDFCGNDYLGLARHPDLIAALTRAASVDGVGSGAAHLVSGHRGEHAALEEELADWTGRQRAVLFSTGVMANLGALQALLGAGSPPGRGDALCVQDRLNHASLIDGAQLAGAELRRYPHADADAAARQLDARPDHPALLATDGVFSMDGDIAPLDRIADLAEHYGAITMVDDAHASGVLGERGSGTVSHYGLYGRWDIQVGTLSKAIGAVGGYVACSHKLRQLMEHRARPLLFSTSHPPSVTATCIAALDLLMSDEGQMLIERLWENTRLFKSGLATLGFNTGISQTPITPVIIGEGARAMQFSDQLFAAGVFAQGIAFPTVARDKGRVRTIVSAAHSRGDLEEALNIFESVGRAMDLI